MAVPKRKVSPSRRNMRRAHDALGANSFIEDKDLSLIHISEPTRPY